MIKRFNFFADFNNSKNILKNNSGENYIDICIVILVVIMVLCLILAIIPVLQQKNQLDYFADELVRTAEIEGEIGAKTAQRANELKAVTGLNPTISWSKNGKIQLNNEFTVTLKISVDVGFGGLGSFPVTLTAKASGKSEVYWKT